MTTQMVLPLEPKSVAGALPFDDPPTDSWRDVLRTKRSVRGDDYAYLRLVKPPADQGTSRLIRVADLFSGCGAISLGAREACASLGLRFASALAVDTNVDALAAYRANFAPSQALSLPMEELFPGELRSPPTDGEKALADSVGPIDLLVGGPPCQGHSDLNNFARRRDSKNGLYLHMGRAAEILRPQHILIENVPGAAHDILQVVQTTRTHLESIGYSTSLGLIDGWQVGVPQRRKRLVLLGSRETLVPVVDELDTIVSLSGRDLRWAIGDVNPSGDRDIMAEVAKPTKITRNRIDFLFDNEVYELPNSERPPCHRDRAHSYNSIYGRLRWDQPAQTITRGFYCMCMGRYVHPSYRRTLTAREAARLQFFPDFFDFSPVRTRSALAEIIGNAVPMKLAYIAALAVLANSRSLENEDDS